MVQFPLMTFLKIVTGPLRNNCYILSGNEKEAVVIDPSGGYDKIRAALENRGLVCRAVLLTHGHFDHIGGAGQLQTDGAEIYLHGGDRDKARAFAPDKNLTDGEILNLAGLKIKAIHTPGHTSGGVCFHINDMLFSGDTLFHGDVGRTDLPSGNFQQLKKSVREKLYILPPETKVFPGHGEETAIGEERAHNAAARA